MISNALPPPCRANSKRWLLECLALSFTLHLLIIVCIDWQVIPITQKPQPSIATKWYLHVPISTKANAQQEVVQIPTTTQSRADARQAQPTPQSKTAQKGTPTVSRHAQKPVTNPHTRTRPKQPVQQSKPTGSNQIPPAINSSSKPAIVATDHPQHLALQQAKHADTVPQVTNSEPVAIAHANYRKKTPLEYPRKARRLGLEGTVLLHAQVGVSGTPMQLRIVHSSGHQVLDQAALRSVEQWEFVPTKVNGRVTKSWVQVPVRFVMQ